MDLMSVSEIVFPFNCECFPSYLNNHLTISIQTVYACVLPSSLLIS